MIHTCLGYYGSKLLGLMHMARYTKAHRVPGRSWKKKLYYFDPKNKGSQLDLSASSTL